MSPVRHDHCGPMDYYIKMRYNHVALCHSVPGVRTSVLSDDRPSIARVAQLDRSAPPDSRALLTYHPT